MQIIGQIGDQTSLARLSGRRRRAWTTTAHRRRSTQRSKLEQRFTGILVNVLRLARQVAASGGGGGGEAIVVPLLQVMIGPVRVDLEKETEEHMSRVEWNTERTGQPTRRVTISAPLR